MKRILIVLSILAFLFTFAADVFSLTPDKSKRTVKVERFTGRVTSVNVAERTVVVESAKAGMTFDLGGAKFKGYKTIENIREGDRVTVQYVMKEGRAIARILSRNKSYYK